MRSSSFVVEMGSEAYQKCSKNVFSERMKRPSHAKTAHHSASSRVSGTLLFVIIAAPRGYED
jgi:hypothetical protein